ncbi:MAG TPA: hypothetical protein VFG63_07890 [Nocardioidaceae bacterium]|nr:hypothetical protein [Nocardioidaceae bacterium]
MSTAHSWTDRPRDLWSDARRATGDVVPLLKFRGAGLRGRGKRAAGIAFGVIALLTVLAAWLPAYLPGAAGSAGQTRIASSDVLLLLPSAYLSVLVIAIVSAAASGGGRELLPREQAVAFPVSPTTDHLGALLMAPLNIAWLVQSWTVLGATAFVVGTDGLLAAQLPVLIWLVVASALAQVISWTAEWVRRGRHGSWALRIVILVLTLTMAVLIATDRLVPLLDHAPTRQIALGVLYGSAGAWLSWLEVLVGLVLIGIAAVVAGAVLSHAVTRRPARDELRVESSVRPPRPNPSSVFVALLRTDRAGIWRSVPLRRGLAVLAVLPGLVALGGGLEWEMMCILPGLVASGGALLFGVNSWCLDGRGALWRDSLPVSPSTVFVSRVVVLVEVLLLATVLTLALGALRAGVPGSSELVAVGCAAVVVSLQVVAASLRWSVRRPFAMDMRSARATPAPPLVMVGYSSRLALTTTLTGMLFTITARLPEWHWSLLVALPFVLFSARKLAGTATEWANPETRSRVIATVAS